MSSLCGWPKWSSHVFGSKPVDATVNASPSHLPTEYPLKRGIRVLWQFASVGPYVPIDMKSIEELQHLPRQLNNLEIASGFLKKQEAWDPRRSSSPWDHCPGAGAIIRGP